jgi:hypothetical protein
VFTSYSYVSFFGKVPSLYTKVEADTVYCGAMMTSRLMHTVAPAIDMHAQCARSYQAISKKKGGITHLEVGEEESRRREGREGLKYLARGQRS